MGAWGHGPGQSPLGLQGAPRGPCSRAVPRRGPCTPSAQALSLGGGVTFCSWLPKSGRSPPHDRSAPQEKRPPAKRWVFEGRRASTPRGMRITSPLNLARKPPPKKEGNV